LYQKFNNSIEEKKQALIPDDEILGVQIEFIVMVNKYVKVESDIQYPL